MHGEQTVSRYQIAFEKGMSQVLKEIIQKSYWKLEKKGCCYVVSESIVTLFPAVMWKVENV